MTAPTSFAHYINTTFETYRRSIDLAIRFILALTFAFAAGVYFKNGFAAIRQPGLSHLTIIVSGVSIIAVGIFTFLIACMYVVRLSPSNKFVGLWPCIAAILGGFLMAGLLILSPQTHSPAWLQIFASSLIAIGNILSALILLKLGRSFSILPESRKLVTTGPYAIVRHPLYLAEAIATVGLLINFISWAAAAIVIAQVSLQLTRIHYEEKVLRQTFPEYRDYAKRTRRLIPGIY